MKSEAYHELKKARTSLCQELRSLKPDEDRTFTEDEIAAIKRLRSSITEVELKLATEKKKVQAAADGSPAIKLPSDPEELRAMLVSVTEEIIKAQAEIEQLRADKLRPHVQAREAINARLVAIEKLQKMSPSERESLVIAAQSIESSEEVKAGV